MLLPKPVILYLRIKREKLNEEVIYQNNKEDSSQ